MPYLNDQAIVLSTRQYKEKDKLVFLMTAQNGFVKCVARRASGPRSKLGTALEILTLLKIQLFRRNEDMEYYSLCQNVVLEQSPLMEGDFETLSCGSFLCEVVNAVASPEQKADDLYRLLISARNLLKQNMDRRTLALGFLYKVLVNEGVAPSIEVCAQCGKSSQSEAEMWYFSPQSGSLYCDSCGRGLQETIALSSQLLRMLLVFERAPVGDLLELTIDMGTLEQIWRILAQHAEFHLHLSFRSLKFLFSEQ